MKFAACNTRIKISGKGIFNRFTHEFNPEVTEWSLGGRRGKGEREGVGVAYMPG